MTCVDLLPGESSNPVLFFLILLRFVLIKLKKHKPLNGPHIYEVLKSELRRRADSISQLARNHKRAYLRFSCRLFCAYLKPC